MHIELIALNPATLWISGTAGLLLCVSIRDSPTGRLRLFRDRTLRREVLRIVCVQPPSHLYLSTKIHFSISKKKPLGAIMNPALAAVPLAGAQHPQQHGRTAAVSFPKQ